MNILLNLIAVVLLLNSIFGEQIAKACQDTSITNPSYDINIIMANFNIGLSVGLFLFPIVRLLFDNMVVPIIFALILTIFGSITVNSYQILTPDCYKQIINYDRIAWGIVGSGVGLLTFMLLDYGVKSYVILAIIFSVVMICISSININSYNKCKNMTVTNTVNTARIASIICLIIAILLILGLGGGIYSTNGKILQYGN